MQTHLKRLTFLLLLHLTLSSTAREGDAYYGKIAYTYGHCAECHMNDALGDEKLLAPKIAGQEEWYIIEQLNKFKNGKRGAHPKDEAGQRMAPLSRMLRGSVDIENLAAYLSSIEGETKHSPIAGNSDNGQKLYAELCAACHGNKFQGNPDLKSPKLTGLNNWYIYRQLVNFKAGIRGSHSEDLHGMQMQQASKNIPDRQAMKDITVFITQAQ